MAYWHEREDGTWYFDWSHLYPILALLLLGLYALARRALEQADAHR